MYKLPRKGPKAELTAKSFQPHVDLTSEEGFVLLFLVYGIMNRNFPKYFTELHFGCLLPPYASKNMFSSLVAKGVIAKKVRKKDTGDVFYYIKLPGYLQFIESYTEQAVALSLPLKTYDYCDPFRKRYLKKRESKRDRN